MPLSSKMATEAGRIETASTAPSPPPDQSSVSTLPSEMRSDHTFFCSFRHRAQRLRISSISPRECLLSQKAVSMKTFASLYNPTDSIQKYPSALRSTGSLHPPSLYSKTHACSRRLQALLISLPADNTHEALNQPALCCHGVNPLRGTAAGNYAFAWRRTSPLPQPLCNLIAISTVALDSSGGNGSLQRKLEKTKFVGNQKCRLWPWPYLVRPAPQCLPLSQSHSSFSR